MQPEAIWTLVLSAIAAIAALGAWQAASYTNRYEESWLLEPRDATAQYLLRNNTRRRAELIETRATPLYPDLPGEPPHFALDGPQNASLAHGEAIGLSASRARGIVVVWRRKVWWRRSLKEYEREFTLPIRYG